MTKKYLVIVLIMLIFVLLIALGIYLAINKNSDENKQIPVPVKEITLNEVRLHSSSQDCWTVIEQSVYDITPYINSHPGGAVITKACGTIGTDFFNSRITVSGENKGPHPQKAKDLLANYRIGIIAPN